MMLRAHPLSFYCNRLDRCCAAGLAVVHQARSTANWPHFKTLEDEDGFVNIVVRSNIYPKYRTILRTSPLIVVEGEVQRQGAVVNVVLQSTVSL